ncbi:MAG TPA: hypothetical protein VGP76_13780 [Planctomycetaceae bacterium]|jgi:hypothetical protein|nr:hypothetical protein [Planctomycetaceae bacterium]
MATDSDIVRGVTEWLQARGDTCGRNFADISGVAKSVASTLPGETPASLEPKIRKLAADPRYGFKVKGNGISAPDRTDPDCGTD